MRFLFFLLGVPAMIMTFFEAKDVLPFVSTYSLMVDGNVVELSEQEQQSLEESVCQMFENSFTMPAFGVVFDKMFQEDVKTGVFVSLKFDQPMEVNNLPFDELVFKVDPTFQGFNLMRGNHGVFQGRCIYIDLHGSSMQDLFDCINNFESVKNIQNVEDQNEQENTEMSENLEISEDENL